MDKSRKISNIRLYDHNVNLVSHIRDYLHNANQIDHVLVKEE